MTSIPINGVLQESIKDGNAKKFELSFFTTEIHVMTTYLRSPSLAQIIASLTSYCEQKLEYPQKPQPVRPIDHKPSQLTTSEIEPSLY